MGLWMVEVTEELSFSEHNKRAHAKCRMERTMFPEMSYRELFAKNMSLSMMLNYVKVGV